MGKIRVYELAKEMGLENQECVKRLVAAGFTVKSHSSTVDEDDARRALARPPEKKVEDKKAVRTVLRRRKPEDELTAEAGPAEPVPAPPSTPVVEAPAEPVAPPALVVARAPEAVAQAPRA